MAEIPALVVDAIQLLTSHRHHVWIVRPLNNMDRPIGAQKYFSLWILGFHAVGGDSSRQPCIKTFSPSPSGPQKLAFHFILLAINQPLAISLRNAKQPSDGSSGCSANSLIQVLGVHWRRARGGALGSLVALMMVVWV